MTPAEVKTIVDKYETRLAKLQIAYDNSVGIKVSEAERKHEYRATQLVKEHFREMKSLRENFILAVLALGLVNVILVVFLLFPKFLHP